MHNLFFYFRRCYTIVYYLLLTQPRLTNSTSTDEKQPKTTTTKRPQKRRKVSQQLLLLDSTTYLHAILSGVTFSKLATTTTSHYSTLGLNPQATLNEIRSAYRSLILINHPDRLNSITNSNRTSTSSTADELNAAWEVLRNESTKEEYDRNLNSSGGEYLLGA